MWLLMSYINESCHTYEWLMSRMNTSSDTYTSVMSHWWRTSGWKSNNGRTTPLVSSHTMWWLILFIQMSHITRMHDSFHIHLTDPTRIHESCHADQEPQDERAITAGQRPSSNHILCEALFSTVYSEIKKMGHESKNQKQNPSCHAYEWFQCNTWTTSHSMCSSVLHSEG